MIIFRYLAKEVYTTVIGVMLVLLLVFMSNQFIRYLADAAAGKLAGSLLIQLMVLQIPHLLGILLPLAFYLAVLLVYGRLYADSELLVLEASGFSQPKLLAKTLLLGVGIAIPVLILNLWLEPAIAKQRDILLAQAGTKVLMQTIMPGRFQVMNNGKRIYYVESISRDRTLMRNIFIADNKPFQFSGPQTKEGWWIVTAASAYPEVDKETGDSFIVLKNGHRYLGKADTKEYQLANFGTYRLRLQEHKPTEVSDEDAKKTSELWRMRKQDPISAAEFHWRIAKSIAVIVLAVLAVPLSRVNPRQGRYARLLPAILIFVLYFNMLLINQDWLAKQVLSWRIGMWPTHTIATLAGLVLFAKFSGLARMMFQWRKTS